MRHAIAKILRHLAAVIDNRRLTLSGIYVSASPGLVRLTVPGIIDSGLEPAHAITLAQTLKVAAAHAAGVNRQCDCKMCRALQGQAAERN